jgi:hypothetical protein
MPKTRERKNAALSDAPVLKLLQQILHPKEILRRLSYRFNLETKLPGTTT